MSLGTASQGPEETGERREPAPRDSGSSIGSPHNESGFEQPAKPTIGSHCNYSISSSSSSSSSNSILALGGSSARKPNSRGAATLGGEPQHDAHPSTVGTGDHCSNPLWMHQLGYGCDSDCESDHGLQDEWWNHGPDSLGTHACAYDKFRYMGGDYFATQDTAITASEEMALILSLRLGAE